MAGFVTSDFLVYIATLQRWARLVVNPADPYEAFYWEANPGVMAPDGQLAPPAPVRGDPHIIRSRSALEQLLRRRGFYTQGAGSRAFGLTWVALDLPFRLFGLSLDQVSGTPPLYDKLFYRTDDPHKRRDSDRSSAKPWPPR